MVHNIHGPPGPLQTKDPPWPPSGHRTWDPPALNPLLVGPHCTAPSPLVLTSGSYRSRVGKRAVHILLECSMGDDWADTHPPPPPRNWWYASYWNASLLFLWFLGENVMRIMGSSHQHKPIPTPNTDLRIRFHYLTKEKLAHIYRVQRKLREGYVFTSICLSGRG